MFAWIKDRKKKVGVLLGYILFGLMTFSLFFYLTFPFHLLESKLILFLEEESGCKMGVDKKGFYFPLRLAWREIRVTCPEQPFSQWNIESFDADVAPFPLLWNRRGEIDFKIRLAGGEIAGHLTVVQKEEGFSFSLKNEGKRLNLSQVGLSGLLDLEVEGSWVEQDILKGKGTLSFSLEEARFREIGTWTVPIGEVSFSNIRGKIYWRNGAVAVEQFWAEGSEVDLTSEGGNLLLREPLDLSLITLTLKAIPKGNLQQVATLFVQNYSGREPLVLGVKGSLRQPQILLNGQLLKP